jgi:hypothetical protein
MKKGGIIWLALAAAAAAWCADVPRIAYTKSFPGSAPAYIGIVLDKAGTGEYREAPDEENPLRFKLRETEAAEIFGLVEKLENFRRPLESPLKVAFMGTKTFRLENGTEKGEVKFNFSEDPSARALQDWFERISESEQHYINLERAVKYDKLGVFKALLLLEASLDRKRLVGTEQYHPLLDRVVKNESYMHTARVRAAGIADAIRANK